MKIFQLLVSGGQPTTATSPAMSSGGALSPGALSPSSTATTTGAAAAAASGGASTPVAGATGPGCCENGRPMMTDPVTGQSVCSCQYDSAARLALGAYPRLAPTATSYSSYPTPTPSTTDQGPYPSIGMDSSAFYPPLVSKQLPLNILASLFPCVSTQQGRRVNCWKVINRRLHNKRWIIHGMLFK